jgi:VanZ family protein
MSDSAISTPNLPAPHLAKAGKASVFARIALIMIALLVIYASWYPLSGWRDNGMGPWAYLSDAMPRYWTWFDLIVNILGYIPLGALSVLALYPFLRGIKAILLTTWAGIALAMLMEAGQTYLPTRVPSNLDLLTNALGVFFGSLCGEFLRTQLLEQSRLRSLRQAWFSDQASSGLIVIGLWPLAQIYPQGYLFGHGQLLPIISGWLSSAVGTPIELSQLLWNEYSVTVEQYLMAEVIITGCCMTGAVLTLLSQMRTTAPKYLLAIGLILAAIFIKAMANAILFTPVNALSWLTPSAAGGLLIGAIMLSGLSMAPPIAQRRVAILALLISLCIVNLAPANPYFQSTLQDWAQGRFLNFNGAAQFLSLIWPGLAIWFLSHKIHQTN